MPDALGMDTRTFIDALDQPGGPGLEGAARILFRAAVAAYLNAAHPEVDFALSTTEIVNRVNAALASGDRERILALAGELDRLNNAGCPDAKSLEV